MTTTLLQTARYAGKTALVTGGASGIGEAIVRRLLGEGAQVVVGDLNVQRLSTLAQEAGERVATLHCDVTCEDDVCRLVELAMQRFGALDAAFNVAGAAKLGLIAQMDMADWDFTVNVCLRAVMLCMKHQAQRMQAQGRGGAIVNVASLNSRAPMVGGAAYCAAKAGVAMLSECGALELGAQGIRVNTVSPGLVITPLTAAIEQIDGAVDAFLARIPLGKTATAQDIAAACCYLGSDDAAYISGANLMVDGAWATTTYPVPNPFMVQT